MLRDVRFRTALNYAIDRSKLCQVAYAGLAAPATTIMPPNTWSDPDYHWQPPAGQTYTFDIAKANQLLDAAGYARSPSGPRLYKGKPITLRLATTTDFPQGQVEAKMIAGWLQQLGLKVNLSVLDTGALLGPRLQLQGLDLRARLRHVPDDWAGYGDPGRDPHVVHDGGDRRHQRAGMVRTPPSTS